MTDTFVEGIQPLLRSLPPLSFSISIPEHADEPFNINIAMDFEAKQYRLNIPVRTANDHFMTVLAKEEQSKRPSSQHSPPPATQRSPPSSSPFSRTPARRRSSQATHVSPSPLLPSTRKVSGKNAKPSSKKRPTVDDKPEPSKRSKKVTLATASDKRKLPKPVKGESDGESGSSKPVKAKTKEVPPAKSKSKSKASSHSKPVEVEHKREFGPST